MAVSRPPRKATSANPRKFLQDGDSAAVTSSDTSSKGISVNLRVPPDLLEMMDATVRRRRLKTPRTRWILEAIDEKLEREADAQDIRIAEDRLLALREGREKTYRLEEVMRAHGNLEG